MTGTPALGQYGSAHVRLLETVAAQPNRTHPYTDDEFQLDGLADLVSAGALDTDHRLTAFGRAELTRLRAGGSRVVGAQPATPTATPTTAPEGQHAMTQYDASAEFPQIAAQIRGATDELENIAAAAERIAAEMEDPENGWTDLVDPIQAARGRIASAQDKLLESAEAIGMAQIVLDARQANRMVGSRSTLGV